MNRQVRLKSRYRGRRDFFIIKAVILMRKKELDLTGRTVCHEVLDAIKGTCVEDELVGIGKNLLNFFTALDSETPNQTNVANKEGEG